MPHATPGNPALTAGKRRGAAIARQHKAAKNNAPNLRAISSDFLPDGDPPPRLTPEDINSMHPVVIGLYQSLTKSEEARHFRTTDWFSVKIILMMVTGHLNDCGGYVFVRLDEDGNEIYRREQYAGVKVGVLAEVNKALESINATPAGRTNYALALAALAKAAQPEDPDADADELARRDAQLATEALLARVAAANASVPEVG